MVKIKALGVKAGGLVASGLAVTKKPERKRIYKIIKEMYDDKRRTYLARRVSRRIVV